MKNETQEQRVVYKLKTDGFITRNECLRNYISRLGALICRLKKQGYVFKTSNVEGDYRYDVVSFPN